MSLKSKKKQMFISQKQSWHVEMSHFVRSFVKLTVHNEKLFYLKL